MTAVLTMADKLQADIPTMLTERKDFEAAFPELKNAATSENKTEGMQFACGLAAHADAVLRLLRRTADARQHCVRHS
jgi:hypothetical protein